MKGRIILIYGLLSIITILVAYVTVVNSQSKTVDNERSGLAKIDINASADKLEVYYFHRTQRCSICLSIGRYTKEVIEQKFTDEIKNGRIDFREINIDLPENAEVVTRFQASGQSLYINSIKDGQDNINQDINIWRLVRSESQFKEYLENQINNLLR